MVIPWVVLVSSTFTDLFRLFPFVLSTFFFVYCFNFFSLFFWFFFFWFFFLSLKDTLPTLIYRLTDRTAARIADFASLHLCKISFAPL